MCIVITLYNCTKVFKVSAMCTEDVNRAQRLSTTDIEVWREPTEMEKKNIGDGENYRNINFQPIEF